MRMRKNRLRLVGPSFLFVLALLALAFFVGTWEKLAITHSRVYGFDPDRAGGLDAYLMHALDDSFGGFRDPVFPVAVIEIDRKETWFAPPSRRGRKRTRIVRLYASSSFTIRVRDGEGSRADGGIWDFPALDQRTAREIEPGSIAYEAMKDQPQEVREVLRDVLDGIPDPGEEIEPARLEGMMLAVRRALREDGFAWVADGVERGSWSRSGVDGAGVVKLLVGGVLIVGGVVVLRCFFPSRK